MYDLKRPPIAAANDDACLAALSGGPVIAAWGMSVDSTAMIIEWVARGLPLSAVLTADTGVEREETYAFLPIFQRWMDRQHIEHHVVRYVPKRFMHRSEEQTSELQSLMRNSYAALCSKKKIEEHT